MRPQPYPNLLNWVHGETDITEPGASGACRENGAGLPVFKPRRLNGFWFLLSMKHFFTPGYRSRAIQGFMHSPWMRLPVPGDAARIAWMVLGWKGFCNQPWTLTHFLSILLWPSEKWRQLGFLSTFQGCETDTGNYTQQSILYSLKKKQQSLLVPCTIITVTRMIKSLTPNGCPTIHFLSP